MKAKTQRQARSKKENSAPELTIEEIQKEIDFYWKTIDRTETYQEYKAAWDGYDKYMDLKKKHFKK